MRTLKSISYGRLGAWECFLFAAVLFFGLSYSEGTVSAAKITAPAERVKAGDTSGGFPDDPAKCDIRLEGAIARGEGAELKRLVNGLLQAGDEIHVCVEGPGGSVDYLNQDTKLT